MAARRIFFSIEIAAVDDLPPAKDPSPRARRERLLGNVLATVKTNLERAIGQGELPSGWGSMRLEDIKRLEQ